MDRLTVEGCNGRQQRLLAEMERQGVDSVVLVRRETICWLTGAWFGPQFEPVAAMDADGQVTLVAPEAEAHEASQAATHDVRTYEAQWHSTLRNDQRAASTEVLAGALAGGWGGSESGKTRLGVEFSSFGPHFSASVGRDLIDIEPTLYRLRRRKDADECQLMARAIDANKAMYDYARAAIEPGICELDLYSELHAVAVRQLGGPLTYFGQDFQSGTPGGPPRDRAAEAGELYILDLGVGYRGYYSDNARTISVDGQPTDAQRAAQQRVVSVFEMIESTVRPGISCRAVFAQAQEMLDAARPWVFDHHLGHGVGLFPHEAPHLNPHWDDVFEPGDFFTVEPGLYHAQLRSGVRIEQNYRVTDDGVDLLTDRDLGL